MEQTLQALGALLVKAVPTLVLVLCLHFYLKYVFFRPLHRVLEARRNSTDGLRRQAEELLARAAEKTAEYERILGEARSQIYQELEGERNRLRQEYTRTLEQARERARMTIGRVREQLEQDLATARAELEQRSRQLAERIAETILRGRAA